MKTSIISEYVFDKSAGTITFEKMIAVDLTRIVRIIDATNKRSIFVQGLPGLGGSVADNILTLQLVTDNEAFSDSDDLVIEYADENSIQTILATALRDANGNTLELENPGHTGAIIMIDSTAFTGTPNLIVKVQMLNHAGNWIDVPGASFASIGSVTQKALAIFPGIEPSANAAVSYPMPNRYRLSWTIDGGSDITFSAGVQFID